MSNSIHFDVSFKNSGKPARRRDSRQFRILILGDFSGQGRKGDATAKPRSLQIDLDNLEQRLQQIAPSLNLTFGDQPEIALPLEFSTLEDFHPDNLYDRVGLFNELRNLREDLLNPKTFTEAAKRVTGDQASNQPPEANEPPATENQTFADLLGKPVAAEQKAKPSHPAVTALLNQFVAPHIVDEPGPEQDRLVASVDAAVAGQMREILHHADFQRLESTWRGLDFLVSNLELDEELSLYMLDLSKSQLAAGLSDPDMKAGSYLYKTVITEAGGTPGTVAWNLILGLYDFAAEDTDLLNAIAQLAQDANTTFIGGISYSSLLKEPSPAWEAMQKNSACASLCLSTPAVLLRLPYGANTDEIDRFEFEEMPDTPIRAQYLWGSAGLVCTALIAKTSGHDDLPPGSITQIDGLPVHSYRLEGEYAMTPCGGAWLSDTDADRLIQQGITPVLSVKNANAVRVLGFQSVAGGPVLV